MGRKDRGGSVGTPATAALTRAKIAYAVRAYEHDPAAESFGLEAAQALGVAPARVFKTLLVDTGTGLAVGVVPVDGTLDLKAIASALGVKKVAMADPDAAERSSGYVVGGISPIGQKRSLPTVVDVSATTHDTVLVSGGRRGLDLELSPEDLVRATGATLAPIARPAA
ncbi:Cys-tRNA(Pro) deacylase [Knoellia sp. LjRoot47]|uniref:Cys-tRNA(Pro) deacylase n=1 Tax=Knoellia sp. LjRoot47 TaxID=3342330 RepID=UPI003ECEE717